MIPTSDTKAHAFAVVSQGSAMYQQADWSSACDEKTGCKRWDAPHPPKPAQPRPAEKRENDYIPVGTRPDHLRRPPPPPPAWPPVPSSVIWERPGHSGALRPIGDVRLASSRDSGCDWVVDTSIRMESGGLPASGRVCDVDSTRGGLRTGRQTACLLSDPTHDDVFHFTADAWARGTHTRWSLVQRAGTTVLANGRLENR